MKKFSFNHDYDIDAQSWIDIVFEPNQDAEDALLELENVKERHEFWREEDDRFVHIKVRYSAMGMIPRPVRHILKPDMLTWIEESSYDKQGRFWTWNIVPHFFRDRITCKGKMSIVETGPEACRRETRGFIDIRIPVVGDLAESVIIDHLKKNMAQEYGMFCKTMKGRRDRIHGHTA